MPKIGTLPLAPKALSASVDGELCLDAVARLSAAVTVEHVGRLPSGAMATILANLHWNIRFGWRRR